MHMLCQTNFFQASNNTQLLIAHHESQVSTPKYIFHDSAIAWDSDSPHWSFPHWGLLLHCVKPFGWENDFKWWFKVSFFRSSSGKKSGNILEPFRHNISWLCSVRSDLLNLRGFFLPELSHGISYILKILSVSKGFPCCLLKCCLFSGDYRPFLLVSLHFGCWQSVIFYRVIFLLRTGAVYLVKWKTINRNPASCPALDNRPVTFLFYLLVEWLM